MEMLVDTTVQMDAQRSSQFFQLHLHTFLLLEPHLLSKALTLLLTLKQPLAFHLCALTLISNALALQAPTNKSPLRITPLVLTLAAVFLSSLQLHLTKCKLFNSI